MITPPKPLFSLGRNLATPGAIEALAASGQTPAEFLRRHIAGDWGDVCPEDAKRNDEALVDGSRILSVYRTKKGVKVWIITEAADDNGNRSATTLLLPSDY
ncbi:MAG TPA: hypothetical protein VGG64_04575 [Pirellulales bacterium]